MKTASIRLLASVVCGLLLAAIPVRVYAQGSFTTLDFPGSTTYSTISGMNSGNFVGRYTDATGTHGYLYDGVTWSILDYPGASKTSARGVFGTNIVGEYTINNDPSGNLYHGFMNNGTNWIPLNYPEAMATTIGGISGGKMVGDYTDPDYGGHGFLYDGTNWTSLDYTGANDTLAQDISGNKIVGYYDDTSYNVHGFLYDGANWSTLDYTGATWTRCSGINESTITGCYMNNLGSHQSGFVYDGTTWTSIDYPGAAATEVTGISDGMLFGCYNDGSRWHGFTATLVPEPSSLVMLLTLCCMGFIAYVRKRSRYA